MTRNGKLLRLTLSRDEKYRLWLPLKSISPVLVKATLLHEDKWFRFHPGVSPTALAAQSGIPMSKTTGRSAGPRSRCSLPASDTTSTPGRYPAKPTQILAAFWLELLYSKNDILEAYLNLVPYGLNIEGAGAASLIYFHKNADKLTLADALTLSVIPQSPAKRIRHTAIKMKSPSIPLSQRGDNTTPLNKGGRGGI